MTSEVFLVPAFYSEVILAAICIWSELGHPILQMILDYYLGPYIICYGILNQDPDFTEPILIDTYPRCILRMQFDDRPINADDG